MNCQSSIARGILASAIAAVLGQASALAASRNVSYFDIHDQPLSSALQEFAQQSDRPILFSTPVVDAKRTRGVRGELDPETALRMLLDGTDLRFRVTSDGTILVEDPRASRSAHAGAQSGFMRLAQVVPVDSAPGEATIAATPVSGSNAGSSDSTAAQGARFEEVVVTGTYIRSESFQPSSPVDTLSREDFEARAPMTVGEFLADLPYNVNSSVLPSGRGATGTPGGGTVNLRNLGEGATLVLLNSRRHTKLPRSAEVVDLNSLVPQIMIRRVDVLKDGASALYGSDAVGGVVNLVTRDDFTGFEVSAQGNWITHSGKSEGRFGALWGAEWDNTRIVAGFEYNDRQMVYADETKPSDDFIFLSAPWQPANYVVPRRDANGQLISGTTTVADVGCGTIVQTYMVNGRCYYDFWPDNSRIAEEQRYQALIRGTHEFTPNLRLTAELGWSSADVYATQSSSGSISVTPGIVVPGHNPGVAQADADRIAAGLPSIFRARNAAGQFLYAVPSSPGSSIPLRDAAGNVVLTANPTDPTSGIPFYEDVILQGRIIGSQGGLPTQNGLGPGEFVRSRPSESHLDVLRTVAVLSGDLGDRWSWEAGFTRSTVQEVNSGLRNNVLIRELRLATAGFGGPNCNPLAPGAAPGQNGCEYFNPFTNSTYATPGAPNANSAELINWLMPAIWDHYETTLTTYDAHVTGELFDLPAGALSVAAGVQYRAEEWRADFDSQKNTGNIESGGAFSDSNASQSTRAAFLEFVVPAFDSDSLGSLRFNAAARYENLGNGIDTTDPKIGFLYSTPSDFLQVRGSWGTSFLAPNLFQKYTESTNLANISDLGPGGTGEATRRVTTINRGNPLLEPQESESYSFGFTIKPLPRLSLEATYWNYDFRKLITLENAQALVNSNDPAKVIRDENGAVIFVVPSYINLSSLETSGLDFEVRYSFDVGSIGTFSYDVMLTYVDTLKVPLANGGKVNVPDSRNSTVTGAPPSVDWRGYTRLQWQRDKHSASLAVRYTDSYKNDSTLIPPGVVIPADNHTVDSFASLDVSYTYTFPDGILGMDRTRVSVGALNVLESSVPRTADTVTLPFNDLRGRVAWLRIVGNF